MLSHGQTPPASNTGEKESESWGWETSPPCRPAVNWYLTFEDLPLPLKLSTVFWWRNQRVDLPSSCSDLTPTPFRGPLGRPFRDCLAYGNRFQPIIGGHQTVQVSNGLGGYRSKTVKRYLTRATAGEPIRLPVPVTYTL